MANYPNLVTGGGVPNGGVVRWAGLSWRPVPVIVGIDRTPTTATTQGVVYRKANPQPLQPTVHQSIVTASLPALTGEGHATTVVRAAVDARLPMLTAAIIGTVLLEGEITASLPMFVANVVGIVPLRAQVNATLPALQGSMTLESTTPPIDRRSFVLCPRPASGFAVSGRVGSLRRGEQ